MSKNNNRNRPRPDNTVQASDTQKTAADVKDDAAKVIEGSNADGAGSITQNTEGESQSSTNDSGRDDEADRARAEEERVAQEIAEEERKEAARLEDDERVERERGRASAGRKVEVRVLRSGHFGTINDVVSIPQGIVEAAEADGSVCSHPASVAEAKALAKGG